MMMTCERCRTIMLEAFYKELGAERQKRFDEHISSCNECSGKYQELTSVLDVMGKRKRPKPDDVYWNGYWERLHEKLDAARSSVSPRILQKKKFNILPQATPSWAYGIAAMLLVAVGVYLGKTYFSQHQLQQTSHEAEVSTRPSTSREDSTTMQGLAYLERTKNLLMGVANLDEEQHATVDLSRQQEASRELIHQANYLKVALNRPDQQAIRQLILDLEVILLQLSNIEVRAGVPAIELVKKGVNQKFILFKINIEEMRNATRHTVPHPKRNSANS